MVFIRVGSRNLPRRSYRSQIVLVLDSSGCGSSFPPESWELLLQTLPNYISLQRWCGGGAEHIYLRAEIFQHRRHCRHYQPLRLFCQNHYQKILSASLAFLLRPLIMVITKKSDNNMSASKDIQAMVSSGKSYLFPSFSLCHPFP